MRPSRSDSRCSFPLRNMVNDSPDSVLATGRDAPSHHPSCLVPMGEPITNSKQIGLGGEAVDSLPYRPRIRLTQRRRNPPMTDSLGFRRKFGVIAPSTNTSVQPEFEAMRPRGVTNHFGRIHIPNDPIRNDADFNQLMDNIRKEMLRAVDEVMTCEPDYLIMGMSSETFWDGLEGSKKLHQRVEARAGVKVSM